MARRDSLGSISSSSTVTDDDDDSISSLVKPATPKGRPRGNTQGRSNSRSLPEYKQKLVATDIEQFGGLAAVETKSFRVFADHFAELDEERAALYGKPNTKQRDQIRNRVQYWKKVGPECYNKLLINWRITPSNYRQTVAPPASPPKTPSSQKKTRSTPKATPVVEAVEDLAISFDSLQVTTTKHTFKTMTDHKVCE